MPDPVTGTVAAASVASGAMGSRAAKKGADVQERATEKELALRKEMFDRTVELQEPFRQAGLSGQNRLLELLGLGGDAAAKGYGSAMQPFGMEQFQQDPGYAFRMSEGMKALERTTAARGGLVSGATMKAAQRYGQDMASQEWQNAFNRYLTQRNAMLNPLQSLAGVGQSTSAELGAAGERFGQMAGESITGGANARASGYMGAANAWANALGQGMNAYNQQQMINRLPTMGDGLEYYTPVSRRVG